MKKNISTKNTSIKNIKLLIITFALLLTMTSLSSSFSQANPHQLEASTKQMARPTMNESAMDNILSYLINIYSSDEYYDGYYNYDYIDDQPIMFPEEKEKSKKRIQQTKTFLTKLLPNDRLKRIKIIQEDSDGYDGILAYVTPIDRIGKYWILSYDPEDVNLSSLKNDDRSNNYNEDKSLKNNFFTKSETLRSIIHEYAHIESLNETQVRHGYFHPKDDEILLSEGTAKKNSYIALFANKFWKDSKTNKIINIDDKTRSMKTYYKHPNSFVSEYASTNFVEDFAESFAEFILSDRKENTNIANKKVNFFYEFPELVELRTHMQKAIQ